jgi:hypothetical protein
MKSLFVQEEPSWKGPQVPDVIHKGERLGPRLDALNEFIHFTSGLRDKVFDCRINHYMRIGKGFLDLCYWIGDENIIRAPWATSPKILWIYMDEDGPTKAFKMWDLPNGEQVEEEVIVSSDEDIMFLVAWITPPFIVRGEYARF